nr:hypothetical protein [Tanacetum cinerariifolium]
MAETRLFCIRMYLVRLRMLSYLLKAQSRMKAQADSKRRELTFNAGDSVFLRIQPVGPVAYQLELPADSKIHPVFHVSLLRPARGLSPSTPPASLPVSASWEQILVPEKVLAHCWVWQSNT